MPLESCLEGVSVRRQGAKPDRERERGLRECRCLFAESWWWLVVISPLFSFEFWKHQQWLAGHDRNSRVADWCAARATWIQVTSVRWMVGIRNTFFPRNETFPKFQSDLQELEGNRKPWILGWILNDFHGVSINFWLDLALTRFWS